jgi:hypothetical protein
VPVQAAIPDAVAATAVEAGSDALWAILWFAVSASGSAPGCRPHEGQAAELSRTFGCVRMVYNLALADRTEACALS